MAALLLLHAAPLCYNPPMADPRQAVEYALRHEGGYSDHSSDRGGATNYGISSRSHPDVDIANLTKEEAIDLYISRYWDLWNLDLIEDQDIANKVFDTVIWMGPYGGVRTLQRALRALGVSVVEDGRLGPETAAAANLVEPHILLPALRSEVAGRVREIVGANRSQDVFRRGWLNRAYA